VRRSSSSPGATLDLRSTPPDPPIGCETTSRRTHTQRAQPTTVALPAGRGRATGATACSWGAHDRTNQNPLGACAITGTGFPIDRQLTSELLGFAAPTCNTYGSIAAVDYLLETASSAAVLLVGLERFIQDLLLWYRRVRLPAPRRQLRAGEQHRTAKRNPVALEHARAIANKALGQAQAIVVSVHLRSGTSSTPKTICSRSCTRRSGTRPDA
jgi:argininosuccinate lyase